MQANSFRILTTYISLIILGSSTKVSTFAGVETTFLRGLRKVEDLSSGGLEIFSNKICAGMLIRYLRVADIVLLMKCDGG